LRLMGVFQYNGNAWIQQTSNSSWHSKYCLQGQAALGWQDHNPTVKMAIFLEFLVPTFNPHNPTFHYFKEKCCYIQAGLFYAIVMFLKNVTQIKHKIIT
jgi:hypothetical protein